MSAPHLFDAALALQPQGEGRFLGQTHPAYANMIGPYGGVTAAQMLNAILQHPERLGEPVAFTVNYAAAVADGPFELHATPARTNRSTQHWTVQLLQDGQVVLTATAVTAARRQTWGGHELPVPAMPAPAETPRADPADRGGPEWPGRYEMRFATGTLPHAWDGRTSADSVTRMWVRDAPPRPLDFASLTAIADVFFPRIWLRRASFVPIGTVSMTVYFHAGAAELAATGSGWLLAQARGQGFANGFFDQAGQLWNEAGALLATTHQVVYYRE